jgi:predicted molibdopterin-dependent oxidoreductase YjgC
MIKINGCDYRFEEGDTVLDVARRNGIYIPTLCHLGGATNTGACRVCVVDVKGVRNLAASCVLPASVGMEVLTDSPRVNEARRMIVALLMVSGGHNCAARGVSTDDWTDYQVGVNEYDKSQELCVVYGNCVLQELAYRYQAHETIADMRLHNRKVHYQMEDENPYIIRDFSRCILCGRCVKACNEVQVNLAISHGYRGAHSKIVTGGDRSLASSDCVFCGECVQVCPVGALVEKDSRFRARYWELNRVHSTCPQCASGCSIEVYTRDNEIITIRGARDGIPGSGHLCVKGRYGFRVAGNAERLISARVSAGGSSRHVTIEDALSHAAGELTRVRTTHGPDSIAGIVSARSTNEDAFAMQKFFRLIIGTNNVDCGMRISEGEMASTFRDIRALSGISFADVLDTSDLFVVVGSDVTETLSAIAGRIKRGVLMREVKLIVADPRRTRIAGHATRHLRPKPGTDMAWIYGIIRILLSDASGRKECADRSGNIDQLKGAVERFDPGYVGEITGIPAALLIDSARDIAGARKAVLFYGAGLTRQPNGTAPIRALADLASLLGIELHPLCALPNARGVCDAGCLPDSYPGYRPVDDDETAELFSRYWGTAGPRKKGLTVAEMMDGIDRGAVKALYVLGDDLSDIPGFEDLVKKLDLLIVQDIVSTRTASFAHVALPLLSPYERVGTITGNDRVVRNLNRAVDPPGDALEGFKVFEALSRKMGREIRGSTPQQVFNEISQVIPDYAGIIHSTIGIGRSLSAGSSGIHRGNADDSVTFHAAGFNPPNSTGGALDMIPVDMTRESLLGGLQGTNGAHQALMNPADAANLAIQDRNRIRIAIMDGFLEMEVVLDDSVHAGTIVVPNSPLLCMKSENGMTAARPVVVEKI